MFRIESMNDLIWGLLRGNNKLRENYLKSKAEVVFENLSKKCILLKIEKEVAFVGVESSSVMHFMNMKKEIYIQKCNEILKENYIKDMKFKISKIN